ncbi:MAG: hypothetical protein ACRD1X_19215 [Vicinamibacteria bacterium]
MRADLRHALTMLTFGKHPVIELTRDVYEQIKKARDALSKGLALEERYEILVSSYSDLETEILNQAVHSMLRRPLGYEDLFIRRLAFNQRLLCLFTAAELCLDTLPPDVAAITKTGKDAAQVRALRRKERAANDGFWFMEALRNHAQHRGLPVHWVEVNHSTTGSDQTRELVYSVTLASARDLLSADKRFFNELLKRMPEKIDLQIFRWQRRSTLRASAEYMPRGVPWSNGH